MSPRERSAVPAGSRGTVSLVPALLAALLACPIGGASPQPVRDWTIVPGEGDRVAGFWGLAWGADSSAVARVLGPPITTTEPEEGARAFVYTVFLLDRDGFLRLRVHRERGLVGGVYEPVVDDCSDFFRRIVDRLRATLHGLEPSTEGRVSRVGFGRDLCRAAMEGEAELWIVWRDAAGGEVRIGAEPGRPGLRVRASAGAARGPVPAPAPAADPAGGGRREDGPGEHRPAGPEGETSGLP